MFFLRFNPQPDTPRFLDFAEDRFAWNSSGGDFEKENRQLNFLTLPNHKLLFYLLFFVAFLKLKVVC